MLKQAAQRRDVDSSAGDRGHSKCDSVPGQGQQRQVAMPDLMLQPFPEESVGESEMEPLGEQRDTGPELSDGLPDVPSVEADHVPVERVASVPKRGITEGARPKEGAFRRIGTMAPVPKSGAVPPPSKEGHVP